MDTFLACVGYGHELPRYGSAAFDIPRSFLNRSVLGFVSNLVIIAKIIFGRTGDVNDQPERIISPAFLDRQKGIGAGEDFTRDTSKERTLRPRWLGLKDAPCTLHHALNLRRLLRSNGVTAQRWPYLCSWCQLEKGQLMVIPHPQSRQAVRHFDYPSQAEVVGRVTGVAMRIVDEGHTEEGTVTRSGPG